MKLFCFIHLLLAFSTTIATNTAITNRESSYENCKYIKCPPIEDPKCVQVVNKKEKIRKNTYVVAINECEIQFIKCRPGTEAKIVSMEKCNHTTKYGKHKNRRYESDASEEYDNTYTSDYTSIETDGDRSIETDGDRSIETDGDRSIETDGDRTMETDTDMSIETDGDRSFDSDNAFETDSYYEEQKMAGSMVDNSKDEENNETWNEYDEAEYEKIEQQEMLGKYGANDVAHDYDQANSKDVDLVQNEKDCPSVCPARNVMVCAKCQHNIYRTFLSICHLRMFNCLHSDEKLELMSRNPCMQSSPFLTNLPKAKGRLSDPGDRDAVLQFIHCRETGRLDTDDPRCQF